MEKSSRCPICSKEFVRGNTRRKYCCEDCKIEARSRRNRRKNETRSAFNRARKGMSGIEKGKLDRNLQEARSKGQTYAEWQQEQTLAMIKRGEL